MIRKILVVAAWLLVIVPVVVFTVALFPPTTIPIVAGLLVFLGFKALKPTSLRKATKWITVGTVVAMSGSCMFAENRAERNANAFCSRFTLGGDFNQAVDAVNAARGTYFKYDRLDEKSGERTVSVVYMGVGPMSRHGCYLVGAEGKIIHVGYSDP